MTLTDLLYQWFEIEEKSLMNLVEYEGLFIKLKCSYQTI